MNNENDPKESRQVECAVAKPIICPVRSSEEEDIGEWICELIEFIRSPEFAEKILPALGEHFLRKHKEVMQRIEKDIRDMENKARYNFHFLIARVIVGLIMVGAVTTLTVYGKIATETTIVTMMVTLGFIIWGNRD